MNRQETWRIAGASLSLANLLAVGRWYDIQDISFSYYRKLPDAWFLLRGTLLLILLYSAAILVLWLTAKRFQGTAPGKCGLFVLLGLMFLTADLMAAHSHRLEWQASLWVLPIAGAGAILAGALVVFQEAPIWSLAQTMLLLALPALPIFALRTGWLIVRSGSSSVLVDNAPLPLLSFKHPNAPHVLWIVFDEFDYEFAFVHPPRRLKLPEMQRLRQTALFAKHATAVGRETQKSIPAYLTGKLVQDTKRQGPAELLLRFEGTKEFVPWSKQPSVFSEARRLGFNSSVTGFFHPYCRLLTDLAACYWISGTPALEDTKELQTTLARRLELLIRQPWRRSPIAKRLGFVSETSSRRINASRWEREEMKFIYQDLLPRGLRAAVNSSYELVYVHLPVPHPPGYFDADKNDFSSSESATYIDNLALVDRTVGEFRRSLEAAGMWDSTTWLITTDHPLRPKDAPGPRDSFRPFGSPASHHVPFMVKLAGQSTGLEFAESFNTVLTRELTLAILRGEIANERALAVWISSHRN